MRRTIVILIVVAILIGAGFLFVRQRQASQNEEFEIIREADVMRGQIAATVNATGSIEPEALVSLSFGVGGTVQHVDAVRGQRVKVGDVLATLDTGELALAVQQAEDGLHIQQLTLQEMLSREASPATLAAAQADIDAAEGNLAIAQANVAAAEASLAQAEAQKLQLLTGVTAGQIAAAESQVANARLQQRNAKEAHDKTLECFKVTLPSGEKRETCPGLGPAEEQARANLENAEVALAAAETQLADIRSGPSVADVRAADAAIAAAESQVASAEGNVLVAQANVDRAEASYNRLQEGVSAEEIAVMEAQVAAAETNLELAQMRLEQAMIISPIEGQVANVLITSGEQAAPGAPAITVVNENAFHIEVSVDEIDIDQVSVGQVVDISLDALPDDVISGQIVEIAPTASTTGIGVVTYLVTINLEANGVTLRPGMTANASIVVEEMDGVLIVPNWAIRLDRESGQAFVNRLAAEGTVEEVTVVTGLRNEQFSEVLSGLEDGDVVVVTNEREGLSFFGN